MTHPTPYERLAAECERLDNEYGDSPLPGVGFRVGCYDEAKQEVCFYAVDNDPEAINRFLSEIRKAGVPFRLTLHSNWPNSDIEYWIATVRVKQT